MTLDLSLIDLKESCPDCMEDATRLAQHIFKFFGDINADKQTATMSMLIGYVAVCHEDLQLTDERILELCKQQIELYKQFMLDQKEKATIQ